MHTRLPFFRLLFLCCAGAVLWMLCVPSARAALRCEIHGVYQNVAVNTPIVLSPQKLVAGQVIWTSPEIRTTLTCRDDTKGAVVKREGRYAAIFGDPLRDMARIDPAVSVEIQLNGINYLPRHGSKYQFSSAPAVSCSHRCSPSDDDWGRRNNWYVTGTLPFTYRVVIKTTGVSPQADGPLPSGNFRLFQVGGADDSPGNLDNRSYSPQLSGLENIRFVSCRPTIRVTGNSGTAINFGSIPKRNAVAGKTEKQIPFSVTVDMSSSANGQACPGQTMQASFSTTFPTSNGTTILPSAASGFGVEIARANTPGTPVRMGENVNLGLVNGRVVEQSFVAGLKWLNANPPVGPFNATATIDVTFR